MEKIAYNEDGPILYVQGNEESVLATTEPYTYVTDLPAGMTQANVSSFHAEAGVIVSGPWVDDTFVEASPVSSVSYRHTDLVSYVINLPATHDGVLSLSTPATNVLSCKTNPSDAVAVSMDASIQVWSNAMGTPLLLLLIVMRSFEADVVLKDGFLYLCTTDHTSSSVIAPGESSGLLHWSPCGLPETNPLALEWEEGYSYSAGSQQLLGSPPSYIADLRQIPAQSFQTVPFSIKDTALPSPDLGINEMYYTIKAVMLSESGGGTDISDMLSLYGITLLRLTQTITLTRNT